MHSTADVCNPPRINKDFVPHFVGIAWFHVIFLCILRRGWIFVTTKTQLSIDMWQWFLTNQYWILLWISGPFRPELGYQVWNTWKPARWCGRKPTWNALNEKKSYTMILCRPKLISKRTPKSVSQFAPSLWFHIGMFRACFLMIRGWSATHNRTQMTTHSQHSFWQSYNNLRHNATPQHRLSHCTLHSACHNPKHLSR